MITPTHRLPVHPGEILEDCIMTLNWSTSTMADRLGLDVTNLEAILDEAQPVTAEVALRLARLIGTTPKMYMSMQSSYDLAVAHRKIQDQLGAIVPLTDAERD